MKVKREKLFFRRAHWFLPWSVWASSFIFLGQVSTLPMCANGGFRPPRLCVHLFLCLARMPMPRSVLGAAGGGTKGPGGMLPALGSRLWQEGRGTGRAAPTRGDSPAAQHRAEPGLHLWRVGKRRAFQSWGIGQGKHRGRETAQGWGRGAIVKEQVREKVGKQVGARHQKAGPSRAVGSHQ